MKKPELTSETVFERLDRLRELLKLVDYLREFRPEPRSGQAHETVAPASVGTTADDAPPRSGE
jgi:hypothetical protein